jgi:hypothetical protein
MNLENYPSKLREPITDGFFIGGFAEYRETLEEFANTYNRAFQGSIEPVTAAGFVKSYVDGTRIPDGTVRKVGKITHSAGAMLANGSRSAIMLNPPEKTSFHKLVIGATRVSIETCEPEPGVSVPSFDIIRAGLHLFRHPLTSARMPLRILDYSAAEATAKEGRYPEGSLIIHGGNDAFGFQADGMPAADQYGLQAVMVDDGLHNSALVRPSEYVDRIKQVIEQNNS